MSSRSIRLALSLRVFAKLRICAARFAGKLTLCRIVLAAALITPLCTNLVHNVSKLPACSRARFRRSAGAAVDEGKSRECQSDEPERAGLGRGRDIQIPATVQAGRGVLKADVNSESAESVEVGNGVIELLLIRIGVKTGIEGEAEGGHMILLIICDEEPDVMSVPSASTPT
jgi:hypothetical protein